MNIQVEKINNKNIILDRKVDKLYDVQSGNNPLYGINEKKKKLFFLVVKLYIYINTVEYLLNSSLKVKHSCETN